MRLTHFLTAARPALFVSIVIGTVVLALGFKLRTNGILACQAEGYDAVSYLAYCHASGYGDYDHGAFWFDMEPALHEPVTEADVLVLGNSRAQVGLSTQATHDWFTAAGARYFLLGFYLENHLFERDLLHKLTPQPKIYVINLDSFFEDWESPFAAAVMKDPDARRRYERKRLWQTVHGPICGSVGALCGAGYVVFRSRETGAWRVSGGETRYESVSNDHAVSARDVHEEVRAGMHFLSQLPVAPECVIATIVPTVGTRVDLASAIAERLGVHVVIPKIEGLTTFDGSHLDAASAERWSRAFFEMAGPQIRKCLELHRDA